MKLHLKEPVIWESRGYSDEDLEKVYKIVDMYNATSIPVSGSWDTETAHEQATIAKELHISLEDAKEIMIDYLGFDEGEFENNSSEPTKNNDNDYIKIGKAIAKYYEEISFNSNSIIIYADNKKALYKEITDALKSVESK